MRHLAAIAMITLAATACMGGTSADTTSQHQRITQAKLTRAVSKAKGATTYCSRHAKDGSRWACLVGDGMDPECFVIIVSADGHWREQDQPRVCRYP
jgi:hypothetical protein